jgi:quercetin dioxygenase-like cupin family protein
VPKLYFAGPRDLPSHEPSPGVVQRVIQADHATVAVTEFAPNTVVDTHRHEVEQVGVVTKGSLVLVIAGEQRILVPGDTYRIPATAAHGARVLEQGAQVIDVWAPPRQDITAAPRPARQRKPQS